MKQKYNTNFHDRKIVRITGTEKNELFKSAAGMEHISIFRVFSQALEKQARSTNETSF